MKEETYKTITTKDFVNKCLNHKGKFIFNADEDFDPERDLYDDICVNSMTFTKAEKDCVTLVFSNTGDTGVLAINIDSIDDVVDNDTYFSIFTDNHQNIKVKLVK